MPIRQRAAYWLLVLPVVPPLLVPLYNRDHPRLLGLPFIFWYQLASALFATVVITVVYRLTTVRRPRWMR